MRKINNVLFVTILSLSLFAGFAQQHYCSKAKIHQHSASNTMKTLHQLNITSSLMDNYDVKFHHLNLSIERTNKNISGYVRTIAKVISVSMDTFMFVLHQNYTIDSIYINSIKQTNITRIDSLIKVKLTASILQNNLADAYIYYHGTAPTSSSALGDGFGNGTSPSWGNQVTWSLSESRAAYQWWPCKQDLRDKIDSSWVFVTTDSTNMVGSNGLLKNVVTVGGKKRYEWKSSYPIDYYLISVAVAKYKPYVLYAKPQYLPGDSILVLNYIYDNAINNPSFISGQKVQLNKIKQTIEFLSNMYGMYPFYKEKYGHSMAPIGGGMEHQTMTTLGFFDFQIDAHEFGHQWFGDYVTCKTWGDIWINEGFASYTEHLVNQYLDPTNFASNLNTAHNNVMSQPGGSIAFTGIDTTNDNRIFDSRLTYDKGGSIIHSLRFVINNDSLFFPGLRHFLNTYKFSTASAQDFKTSMETYTGQNFTQFFTQWYYGEGYPTFNVQWNYFGNTLIIQSTQTTSMPSSIALFTTPIEYKLIRSSGGDTTIRVMHSHATESYTMSVNGNVTGIQVDPNNWIINKTIGPVKVTTLTVAEYIDQNNITLFPNPTNKELSIDLKKNLVGKYQIVDVSGKIIFEKPFETQLISIDVSRLSEGVYYVIIKDSTGQAITTKEFMKVQH